MPSYLKIIIYLSGAITAGALVAPPIFWAGQALDAAGLTEWLAKFPFHRVLSRSLQVSALVFLVPALRWIGLRRPGQLNLQPNPSALTDTLVGILLAVGIVALLSLGYFLSGMFEFRAHPDWAGLGRVLLTATFVSGIEEIVFRGVILGVCLWTLPRAGAIFVTTVLFVTVHFIKPSKTKIAPDEVQWSSGFSEVLRVGDGLPVGVVLAFGVASLFVAGWILGSAAVRTHSLWLPIGLHAGWILGQQSTGLFLRPASARAEDLLPWVGPNLVTGAVPTGLLPLLALLFTGFLVKIFLHYVFRPADSKVG